MYIARNFYINYLLQMISQEEDALSRAADPTARKVIQCRLDSFKEQLAIESKNN